tara:strand:+ start:907 stop:1956 length:1050 start_codon:yes stop_codon:yes gene_type:complete
MTIREEFKSIPANRLFNLAGRKGWIVPSGLLFVLLANLTALFVPFLSIDFMGKEVYSLPHSVQLMWETKLYLIAILIVVFSITFPLFKTVSLILIWFSRIKPANRHRFIHLLESAGKWSMFDIFVVILLMVISTKQNFINTEPQIGLMFFIIAIIGNMLMSRVVATLDRKLNLDTASNFADDKTVLEPLNSAGRIGWLMPFLVLSGIISLIYAIELPFFKINNIPLFSKSYSIHTAIEALFLDGRLVLTVFMVLFLCVAPLLSLVLIGQCWMFHKTRQQISKRLELIRIVGEWSMLSVFLMALSIVVTEGEQMVKTEIRPGIYAIIVAIAFSVLCTRLSEHKLRRLLDP